jgi:hypothetical protein
VTVVERRAASADTPHDVEVLECSEEPTPTTAVVVTGRWSVPRRSLTDSGWRLAPPSLFKLDEKICAENRTLEIVSERVSAGLATGRDALYVLAPEGASAIEEELLRPAIRGRDLTAYKITDPGLRILVPYAYDGLGRSTLVDLEDYPNAYAYLNEHRSVLEQRHCVRRWGKAWYDLHDPVPPADLAARTKILVPDIAYGSRFALDEGRYLPLHSAYYIITRDIDPLFLTAVLNSKPLEFLIRLRTPKVKDGFSRYRKQFLTALPVPAVGAWDVESITDAASVANHNRVNELLCAAFGLSVGDVGTIDNFLAHGSQGAAAHSTEGEATPAR